MEKKILTCPLTGVEFELLILEDELQPFTKAIAAHPIEHYPLDIYMNERFEICIPYKYFEHVQTVTRKEASEILNVSPQRITQILADELIATHEVNGTQVFKLKDVLEYKENRKLGRPARKE